MTPNPLPRATSVQIEDAGMVAVRLVPRNVDVDMDQVMTACERVANFADYYRSCPKYPACADDLDIRKKLYDEALAALITLLRRAGHV